MRLFQNPAESTHPSPFAGPKLTASPLLPSIFQCRLYFHTVPLAWKFLRRHLWESTVCAALDHLGLILPHMPAHESPQHRTKKVSPQVFKQKIAGWGLYCFKSDQNRAIHLGEIYTIQLKIIKKIFPELSNLWLCMIVFAPTRWLCVTLVWIDSKLLCRTKNWEVLTGRQVFVPSSGWLLDPANTHTPAVVCFSLPAGSSIL